MGVHMKALAVAVFLLRLMTSIAHADSDAVAAAKAGAAEEQAAAEREKNADEAAAAFVRRRQSALSSVQIFNTSLRCNDTFNCAMYQITTTVKNNSAETVTSFSIGWVIIRPDVLECPDYIAPRFSSRVKLNPGDNILINLYGNDGEMNARNMRYCVKVTELNILP